MQLAHVRPGDVLRLIDGELALVDAVTPTDDGRVTLRLTPADRRGNRRPWATEPMLPTAVLQAGAPGRRPSATSG
jgi:hypothetical protein